MINDDFLSMTRENICKPQEELQAKVFLFENIIEYSTQKNDIKHSYTYNENGKILTYLNQIRENNLWINVRRENYTYNENDQILLRLNDIWDKDKWINEYKHTYEYDSYGNLMIDYGQNWENDGWVNKKKYTRTYDDYGYLMSLLYEVGIEGKWINSSIQTYEYDKNGNMILYLRKSWKENHWMNYWKIYWSYLPNGKIKDIEESQWHQNRIAWMCQGGKKYKYDSRDNTISDITLGGGWSYPCVEDRRRLYTYDYKGNLLTVEDSRWYGKWGVSYQKILKYDDNDNTIYYLYEWTDDPGSAFIVREQHYYSYDEFNNLLLEKVDGIENEQWVNYRRYTQTFDSQGNFLSHLYEQWADSIWLAILKHNYYYDDRGNQITRVDEKSKNDSLINDLRYSYSYDEENNLQSILFEIWNNDQWLIHDTTLSFYDSYDNRFFYRNDYKIELSWTTSNLVIQQPIEIFGAKSSCEYQNKNYRLNKGEYENIRWQVIGGKIISYNSDSTEICVQWEGRRYGKIILELTEDGINKKIENTIKIYPVPEKPVINHHGNKLLASESLNIQWYFNGNVIEGANSQAFAPIEEGNYSVTTTNEYGCKSEFSDSYYYEISDVDAKKSNENNSSVTIIPNPLSPKTKIFFKLDIPAQTKLTIYNSLGYQVAVLINEYLPEGKHEAIFDGVNLASGTYYFVLQSGSRIETGKMILINN
ncbi:T9SS type A sorting domain-containing protein [Bacteroidota bacterium]